MEKRTGETMELKMNEVQGDEGRRGDYVDAGSLERKGAGLRVLDGLLWILATVSGTAETVICSVLLTLTSVYDVPEGAEDYYYGAVHLSSENNLRYIVGRLSVQGLAALVIFIVMTIGLMILTGRFLKESYAKKNGTTVMIPVLNGWDKCWSEAQLLVMFGLGAAVFGCGYVLYDIWFRENWFGIYEPLNEDLFLYGIDNRSTIKLAIAGIVISVLLFLIVLTSVVKKLKARKFWRYSLIGTVFRGIGRGFGTLTRGIRTSEKETRKYIWISLGMMVLAMTWVGAIADVVIILVFLPRITRKLEDISFGVSEVKNGFLTYKIPVERDENGPKTSLDMLADDINQISTASHIAVQNELKNQRMKTELISNVSHDLKTPLTSMVSYIDLLKKEGLDSENALTYLNIIDEKTDRLKVLTENLFEAAKASSGSIPVTMERLNMASLVTQSVAEMEERLAEKNLDVIVTDQCEKETMPDGSTMSGSVVSADGQLLWRVIENIFSNVSKYALPGSRVYVDLKEIPARNGDKAGEILKEDGTSAASKGKILLEVKNISKDALNIPAEELLERFKRGDESRNTEGSGLGLAIANDLTKLMNGVFEVSIDGDLFKSSVMLEKA